MTRPLTPRTQIVPLIGETFREYGFEGASLSLIGKATGLGKGSLYHFFPGGKEEMANAVLAEIDLWFEREVFAPLASREAHSVENMFDAVETYFRSGRRICLVGAFALNSSRDRFAETIHAYFQRWVDALAQALGGRGYVPRKARARAEEIVAGIQGGIVLARALGDEKPFARLLSRLRKRARQRDS